MKLKIEKDVFLRKFGRRGGRVYARLSFEGIIEDESVFGWAWWFERVEGPGGIVNFCPSRQWCKWCWRKW